MTLFRHGALGLLLVATFALGTVMPRPGAAQEATPPPATPPTAIQLPTECDAPQLPPGTPTPMEELILEVATPEATPVATPITEAVPVSDEEEAEIEPTPAPAGEPADEATAARVEAGILNFAACLNLGDYEGWLALYTEDFLLEDFGTTNPYDALFFVQIFGELFDITVRSVENVQVLEDGRFSAETELLFGNQVAREINYWVEEDGYLKYDGFEELEVEQPAGESVTVEITTDDHEFQPSEVTVEATDVIVVRGHNAGEYHHEIALVQLPAGFEPEQFLEIFEGEVPEGMRFIGAIDLEPGEEAEMYLVDLAPGTYTMICLFDEPDGIPHVMEGMYGTFTVEGATS